MNTQFTLKYLILFDIFSKHGDIDIQIKCFLIPDLM